MFLAESTCYISFIVSKKYIVFGRKLYYKLNGFVAEEECVDSAV
jgi:hypothetical protein